MMPDGVTITETTVIKLTIVIATTTSAMIKEMGIETISTIEIGTILTMEIETISTMEITKRITTTITAITIEDTATTEMETLEEITEVTMEDSTIQTRISEIMVKQITTSSAMVAEASRMDMREIQGQGTVQLGGRFAITADSAIILVKYASDDRVQHHSKEAKTIRIAIIQI